MRKHSLLVFAWVLTLCAPARAEPVEELPKLVVLDLVSERDIDEGVIRLLNELLLTEFQRTGQYKVIGGSDIQTILSNEMQRQLMDCGNASCLAEIGGALGADLLASANIGRIGGYYLLNVKVLNVRTAEVVRRWSEQVEGIEDKLMTAVRTSVRHVAEPATPKKKTEPIKPVVEPAAPATAGRAAIVLEPTGVGSGVEKVETGGIGIAPIGLWAAGGVGLALGIGFGIKTRSHYANATDPDHVGGQVEGKNGRTSQVVANVAYGVGAASAAAGLLVWWLSWNTEDPAVKVSPGVSADALSLGVAIDF